MSRYFRQESTSRAAQLSQAWELLRGGRSVPADVCREVVSNLHTAEGIASGRKEHPDLTMTHKIAFVKHY